MSADPQVVLPPCPVGASRRAWIEARMGWILEAFGWEKIRRVEVAVPGEHGLLDGYEVGLDAAREVFARVCDRMGVRDERLTLEFYGESSDDLPAWEREGRTHDAAGTYSREGWQHVVRLSRRQLEDPPSLVATIAHELGHVLLIGQGRITGEEPDQEPLTDLLTVFLGMGVWNANGVIRERNTSEYWSIGNLGYLRQEEFAYALALLVRFQGGEEPPAWAEALDTDVRQWLSECLVFLAAKEWGTLDARRAQESSRKLDAIDFDALRMEADDEAPETTTGGMRWLVLLFVLPLALCLTKVFLPGWLEAENRDLHVINATRWKATVALEGTDPPIHAVVEPGERTTVTPGEGSYVAVVRTQRGEERVDVAMTTEWGERDKNRQPVFVINVLGAATLAKSEVVYAGRHFGPPKPELFFGNRFVVFREIDDVFELPPSSMLVQGDAASRYHVEWVERSGDAVSVLERFGEYLPAERALELLELHLRLNPSDQRLQADYNARAREAGLSDRATAFLKGL